MFTEITNISTTSCRLASDHTCRHLLRQNLQVKVVVSCVAWWVGAEKHAARPDKQVYYIRHRESWLSHKSLCGEKYQMSSLETQSIPPDTKIVWWCAQAVVTSWLYSLEEGDWGLWPGLILISDEAVTQRMIPSGFSLFPLPNVFFFLWWVVLSFPVWVLSQQGSTVRVAKLLLKDWENGN